MKTRLIMLLASSILIVGSCKKVNFDLTSGKDAATAQILFEDLDAVVEDAAKDQAGLGKTDDANEIMGDCVIITTEWTNGNQFPVIMTIDFGSQNCPGHDGRNRRGKVIAVLSAPFQVQGSVVTITPDEYFMENTKVEGRKVVTNQGPNASSNWVFSIQITDGQITKPDGGKILWESTHTNEWVEGDTSLAILDDVYHINGSGSGVDSKGRSFTMQITRTLEVHLDCKWIKAGEITVFPDRLLPRVLDYGNGGCDNDAMVTINEFSIGIKL